MRGTFWILLSSTAALFAGATGHAQTPSQPVEQEVQAPGPDGPLAGTWVSAGADSPVVLLIPGSGPTDRDGNNPMGMKAASLKLLADGLAGKGVSSVRIDKRGMFGSKAAVPDPSDVTIGAYDDDVESWITAMQKRTGAHCLWLAGHSEGGLVALSTAQRDAPICGLILLESPGRPMGDLMREQLRANPLAAPLLPDADKAIDALEAGKTIDVSGLHPAVGRIFYPGVQKFLIDEFAQRPAALAAAYKGPMMIVWGTKDIQVARADYDALASAAPDARTLVVPDMNHVLKTVTSDSRDDNIAAYGNPDLPLSNGLVDAIATFIKAHPAND